jgi:protein transport protein SEC13
MDGKAKIWQENPTTSQFDMVSELASDKANTHDDWVRDVAWCSNIGTMRDMIATVGEDHRLKIWKNEHTSEDAKGWTLDWDKSFQEPVWKCTWSPVGFMLAVSFGDNQTRVFKANQDGEWEQVSQINEKGELQE